MPIYARKPESNFKPAPEGLHQAVCCDVWDPYEAESGFEAGKMVTKTRIVWQLEVVDEEHGRPYEVSQIYTLSLSEKANLRKMLEAWRGRKFSTEELKGFDLEKLIGANGQVQVVHNAKEGGDVYANVQAVVPIGKNMTKLTVTDGYVRHRDRVSNPQQAQPTEAAAGDEDLPF